MDQTVVHNYAEALFNISKRKAELPRLADECGVVAQVLGQQPKLRRMFEAPQISSEAKVAFMDRVFGERVSAPLLSLLKLLLRRKRIDFLREILERIQILVSEDAGLHVAEIRSAHTLASQDRTSLQQGLERYTGKRLKLDYIVDPRLLGGILFRFQDLMIDYTLRAKLDELREIMMSMTVTSRILSIEKGTG